MKNPELHNHFIEMIGNKNKAIRYDGTEDNYIAYNEVFTLGGNPFKTLEEAKSELESSPSATSKEWSDWKPW